MNIKKPIAIFLVFIVLSNCEVADYVQPTELPEATQTGKRTFGVKINESIWIPFQRYKSNPNFKPVPVVWGRYQNQTLRLTVTNQETRESISLMVDKVTGTGTYKFMTYFPKSAIEFTPYASVYQRCVGEKCAEYSIAQDADNEVIITTLDPIQKIYSGTFKVTFQNKDNPGEVFMLKDGRFDVKEE
jgi:isocitrate dehydrogenase